MNTTEALLSLAEKYQWGTFRFVDAPQREGGRPVLVPHFGTVTQTVAMLGKTLFAEEIMIARSQSPLHQLFLANCFAICQKTEKSYPSGGGVVTTSHVDFTTNMGKSPGPISQNMSPVPFLESLAGLLFDEELREQMKTGKCPLCYIPGIEVWEGSIYYYPYVHYTQGKFMFGLEDVKRKPDGRMSTPKYV